MNTMQVMRVRGIRSFSPHDPSDIKFQKPLTIIVGPNGSGKTTLIEAMKYACTGELPPNSNSGQAFIFDPKLVGLTEVKAEIRLKFELLNGDAFTVVRIMNLSQKGDKQQFKATDAALLFKDAQTQKTTQQSKRCADVDKEIPDILHVSKAILENVVFCHQEDSNWPLDAPNIVKKIFDDIFASTRYAKALEAIRSFIKDQQGDTKANKIKLDHLDTMRKQAASLREQLRVASLDIAEKEREIAAFADDVDALQKEKDAVVSKLNDIRTEKLALEKLESEEANLKSMLSMYEKQITTKLDQKSDEQLRKDHEAARKDMTKSTTQLEEDRKKLQAEIEALNKRIEERSERKFRLNSDIENLKTKKKQRDKLLRQLSHEYNIMLNNNHHTTGGRRRMAGEGDNDDDSNDNNHVSDDVVLHFEQNFNGRVEAQQQSLNDARETMEEEDARMSKEVEDARVRLNTLKANSSIRTKDMERLMRDVQQQKTVLESVDSAIEEASVDAGAATLSSGLAAFVGLGGGGGGGADGRGALQRLLEQKEREEEELKKYKSKQQKTAESERKELKDRIDRLQSDLDDYVDKERSLQQLSEKKTLFDVKNSEVNKKKEARAKLLNDLNKEWKAIKQKLKKDDRMPGTQSESYDDAAAADDDDDDDDDDGFARGERKNHRKEVNPLELKEFVDGAAKNLKKQSQELKSRAEKERDSLTALQTNLKLADEDWKKKQAELRACLEKLGDEVTDFEDKLKRAQTKLDERVEEYTAYDSANKVFKRFQERGVEKGCCPVCDKDIEKSEMASFREKLEKKIKEAPAKLAAMQEKVAQARAEVAALQDLAGVYRDHTRLTQSVEAARRKQKELADAVEKAKVTQESATSTHQAKLELEKELVKLSTKVDGVIASTKEFNALVKEVDSLKGYLSADAASSSRDDLIQQQLSARERLGTAKAQYEKQQEEEKKITAQMHKLEMSISKLTNRVTELAAQTEKKEALEKEIRDKEARLEKMRKERNGEEKEAKDLATRVQQLEKAKEEKHEANREALSKESVKHTTMQGHLTQLLLLKKEIDRLSRLNYAGDLAEIEKSIEEMKESVAIKRRQDVDISNEIANIKDEERRKREHLTNLEANVKVREQRRSIVECQERIKAMRMFVESMGNEKRLHAQRQEADKKLEGKKQESARIEGAIQEKQRTVASLKQQLGKDEVRHADKEYNEQYLSNVAMKIALDDLRKYQDALDAALNQFHKAKIAEINKHILELWMQTYHGKDIDTIEIRSDGEGTGKSSYNYRVVMVKGDQVLNMRGRCSAGQKVLACLIIRLALADAFCNLNCGVMTLDEPTTNLDDENAKGLASCLNALIDSRKKQTNFQLIVITHDENFVKHLGTTQHTDHYYRISKHPDTGYSTIVQQSFGLFE